MQLHPGDKITIINNRSTKSAIVVAVYKEFITVDFGGYKGTVTLSDITIGKVKIFNSEGKEMYRSILPFTKDQLLEKCKIHGTNPEAAFKIAESFGCTDKQVLNAISNYNIRKKIKAQQEEDMAGKQLPISKEQLLIECRTLGTDKEAIKTIATTYGATEKQIEKAILNHGIRKKLTSETKDAGKTEDNTSVDCSKQEEKPTMPANAPKIDMEVHARRLENMRLKPKILIASSIDGEYELDDEELIISATDGTGNTLRVNWKCLADFIQDLQEIKEIAG